jgi:2-isopropylmalate synthase
MKTFKMIHVDEGSRRQLKGDFIFEGQVRTISGEGNGPLSAVLTALHSQIDGVLAIREYSEHSIGEGADVKAASYVELVYELSGQKKTSSWGVGIDTDITASGIRAVLSAVNRLEVVLKKY